jgi:hypothetical protein
VQLTDEGTRSVTCKVEHLQTDVERSFPRENTTDNVIVTSSIEILIESVEFQLIPKVSRAYSGLEI